jgi:hypothetical protein
MMGTFPVFIAKFEHTAGHTIATPAVRNNSKLTAIWNRWYGRVTRSAGHDDVERADREYVEQPRTNSQVPISIEERTCSPCRESRWTFRVGA